MKGKSEHEAEMGKRRSGVLLHLTSLPSIYGIGDMGPEAFEFVDFLARAGQSCWQVLPLNPTGQGEGNSPYNASSAFAGNTLLISPELLERDGLISPENSHPTQIPGERVDHEGVIAFKVPLFDQAYENFKRRGHREDYELFCAGQSHWLDDFALFEALKAHLGGRIWNEWPPAIRDRDPAVLQSFSEQLASRIEKEKFLQFVLHSQWIALKRYSQEKGIKIIGDIPIYTSFQSADVWAHPEIFKLDRNKRPIFVSGVPPDYFSKTGQLWGNPVYDWSQLQESGFDWWIKRMEHNLKLFDAVRIDHFRGFVGYWEIPAEDKTAANGRWVKAPGTEFFTVVFSRYPEARIIAEDLGLITPDVRELMRKFNLPGMRLLLFAFGRELPKSPYAPHNHIANCVIYTGTHDNNTVRGWFETEASNEDKQKLFRYLGRETDASEVSEEFIRLAMMSVADTVILPMQDILGLGAEARMNTPSTTSGNWKWRLVPGQLTLSLAMRLRDTTEICGRLQSKSGPEPPDSH